MQWPPTPGPGKNGTKPYGFVAAALMTSMTSSPRTRPISANSLAKAIFTARNVFSTSFVISAVSGALTRWISAEMPASNVPARRAQPPVTPPTTRGTLACGCVVFPGSMRSGLKATCTSVPTSSPRSASGLTSKSRVVPT